MHGSERPEAIWVHSILPSPAHPSAAYYFHAVIRRKEIGEGKTSRFLIPLSLPPTLSFPTGHTFRRQAELLYWRIIGAISKRFAILPVFTLIASLCLWAISMRLQRPRIHHGCERDDRDGRGGGFSSCNPPFSLIPFHHRIEQLPGLPGDLWCDSWYYACLHPRHSCARARYFHSETEKWGRRGETDRSHFHRSSRTRLQDYAGNLEIYLCMCVDVFTI